jgi:multidrug resistance efflux pump
VFSLLPPEKSAGNYVKVAQRKPLRIDFNQLDRILMQKDCRNRACPWNWM